MHTFQPLDLNEFMESPFELVSNSGLLVTSEFEGKLNPANSYWGGLGAMWGKPAVFIVLGETSYTGEIMAKSGMFSVSFLDKAKYHSMLKYMAQISGRNEDKIAGARLNVAYRHKIPYTDEADKVILSRVMYKGPLDESMIQVKDVKDKFYEENHKHDIYIGEVIEVLAR